MKREARAHGGHRPVSLKPANDNGPKRGPAIAGFVFVVVLVIAAVFIVQTMIGMAHVQDCAVTGRTNC